MREFFQMQESVDKEIEREASDIHSENWRILPRFAGRDEDLSFRFGEWKREDVRGFIFPAMLLIQGARFFVAYKDEGEGILLAEDIFFDRLKRQARRPAF